jgi:nitroreductase
MTSSNTSPAHTTIQLLRKLRAVRDYRPDPIPKTVIDDLLATARWTGSAMNSQPWHIIVVQAKNILVDLAACDGYVKHLAKAPLGMVLAMNAQSDSFDEGRLAERIMLAAAAHNLGSGVAWFSESGCAMAAALLNVPNSHRVRTIIALGYPSKAALQPRSKPGEARKPLHEIVHFDRW